MFFYEFYVTRFKPFTLILISFFLLIHTQAEISNSTFVYLKELDKENKEIGTKVMFGKYKYNFEKRNNLHCIDDLTE